MPSGARPDITWVVDPIDGTVNYAYGIPAYAVSIAAVRGEPEPGAVGGARGRGLQPGDGRDSSTLRKAAAPGWTDDRLAVNEEPSPAGALLATGFGYDPATHAGDLARVARVMPMARDLRRIGAASLDLAYVAAGRFDGYFERGLQPWDHAAGALLVEEAGGRFTRVEIDGLSRSTAVRRGWSGTFRQPARGRGRSVKVCL